MGSDISTMRRIEKRIAFLITAIGNQGGAEVCLVALAKGLRDRGWDVRVVSLRTPFDAAKVADLEAKGVIVDTLALDSPASLVGGVVRLVRILRRAAPAVLHTHMVHANLLGRAMRPLTRVPVLVSAARSSNEGPRWRTWAYRLTDRWCEVTVHVSSRGAELSVRSGAVPASKIRVIPNGIDVRRFDGDTVDRDGVRRANQSEDKFVWLAVGRLTEAKDYGNAIAALAELRRREPSAVLWIAGDGELGDQLRRQAEERGVADHIRFLGFQRDVGRLLNAADAYVMSSAWEGMPNALLEAAAAGLPLVATDVGGNAEIVLDAKTGFLVPPRDPSALAAGMAQVMSMDPEARARMGHTGREYVRVQFSLETMIDRWENLYLEFMGSESGAASERPQADAATSVDGVSVANGVSSASGRA